MRRPCPERYADLLCVSNSFLGCIHKEQMPQFGTDVFALSSKKKKISVPNACIQNKRRRTGFLNHSSEYFELRIFYLYPRHSWETKNILFKSQVPQSLREGWDILSGSVWAEETSWTDFFKQILPKKKKDTQFWSAKI